MNTGDASLRAAYILTSLNPGGTATQARHLAAELRKHNVECEFILTLDRGAVADLLEQEGFTIHQCYYHGREEFSWSYRVGKLIRRSYLLTFRHRLTKTLKTIRPGVVHSFMHGELWLDQISAAHHAGAPFLLNFGSPSSTYPQTRLAMRFNRRLRPGDRLLGVGPGIYDAYHDYLSSVPATFVAYPGQGILNSLPDPGPVDAQSGQAIRRQFGIPADAFVVGSIGRLITHKQVDDLISAIHRLSSDQADIHILLVGDGSERANLETLARELGLADRIHFTGFQTNPTDWLNAMDCYALLSLFEGLPVALLEAMARGLPIVATDVPGIRDVIQDDVNGILVPLNDIRTVASTVGRLMQSESLRDRLGAAARREFLAHYQIAGTACAFKELYMMMIAERRTGRAYVP